MAANDEQVRAYIRHPIGVPIEVTAHGDGQCVPQAQNLSLGGLCFAVDEHMEVGDEVTIRIPIVTPSFVCQGRVVWCKSLDDKAEIGVQFIHPKDAYAARMVEQVCHIEHYRAEVESVEGRCLSMEEAANEWIDRYAADFPRVTGD